MPKYFHYFPQTIYNVDDTKKNVDVVTNILSKFAFENSFKDNSVVYYEYVVGDGETPEMLAHKFYGDAEKHWIILSLNDYVNPQNDWPIEQRSLIKFINKKYETQADTANTGNTGIQWARTNIQAYYKIETQVDAFTGQKTVNKYEIDAGTYANTVPSSTNYTLPGNTVVTISVTKDVKTYLDYEYDVNEAKRQIKILKPEFVNVVEQELIKLFE